MNGVNLWMMKRMRNSRIPFLFITAILLTGCATDDIAAAPENTTTPASVEMKPDGAKEETSSDVLVVYFSATGNTKNIAEIIAETLNADLFEIEPADTYSEEDLNYNNDDCRANTEHY